MAQKVEDAGARQPGPLDAGAKHRLLLGILAQDDVQETLESQCASDDLMEIMAEREERALGHALGEKPGAPRGLDAGARQAALWCMAHLAESLQLLERSWFDAVTLLDIYCLRAPTPVEVGDLPALCGALVRLLKKADCAHLQPWCVLPHSLQLAQWLRHAGHEVGPVTAETLEEQENLVLVTLQWRLHLPTVDPWMSAFCARMSTVVAKMSALTCQGLLPTLSTIWQQGLCLARTLMLARATGPKLSPRHVARGLLVLGCAAARLLPPGELECGEELEGLFKLPRWEGGPQGPAPAAPRAHHQFILELVQLATMSDIATLQEDGKLVTDELREIQSAKKVPVIHSSV